jgi:transcription elongation factor Elf1
MNVYCCPSCSHQSVVWDARSMYFVCRNATCGQYFSPPQPEGLSKEETISALSQNRLMVSRAWIARAVPMAGIRR